MVVNECEVLKKQVRTLNVELPCAVGCARQLFPSYYDKDENVLRGCLIAHTMLSLIEFLKLSRRLTPVVARSLSKARLTFHPQDVVILSILLHDLGKLAEQYINPPSHGKTPHNVWSALISYNTLDKPDNGLVALAVLLHHEFFHWKELEKADNYYLTLSQTLKNLQRIHFVTEKLSTFVKLMGDDLTAIGLKHLINVLLKAKETMEMLSNAEPKKFQKMVTDMEINTLEKGDVYPMALPIYWLLSLTDNRAASARETYWLESLEQASFREPHEFLCKLKQVTKKPVMYLTAIP